MDENPVVVVGAGPVGLAAAAEVVERGLQPLVLEAGSEAGCAVREWSHVRLFSQWSELIDPAAGRLLEQQGWQAPEPAGYPSGAEWVEQYLRPLAAALGERVRFGSRVVGVARRGRDRVVDAGRESEPLTVHVETAAGDERIAAQAVIDASGTWRSPNPLGDERIAAQAVIDASGTWRSPNPLGGDGLPAAGERAARDRISYQVPDLSDAQVRARFAGKRIAVVGSGHSALTALVTFAALSEEAPGTEVVWVLRRGRAGDVFGGGEADQLPERGALGQRAAQAVDAGHVRAVTGFRTAAVETDGDGGLVLTSFEGDKSESVDEVVVLTGFRPDLSWLSEIRLDLDPVLQAPTALAPLIDPNVHSCGTVYPHGAKELAHPEPGVFVVGMKSYGRAPTFLAMTGYEQVRSVAAAIAGDTESAERVELVLPETGVCGGAGVFDEPEVEQGGGCCAGPQQTVELAAPGAAER